MKNEPVPMEFSPEEIKALKRHVEMTTVKSTVDSLPEEFDGTFRFTNFSEDDFASKWDNVEYTFPANKTTPIIIPTASPLQIQYIRKKFAEELAKREFYKTDHFKTLNAPTPNGRPATYVEKDLAPLIQRCLEPLPKGVISSKELPRNKIENVLKKDSKGRTVTRVVDQDTDSLVAQAAAASE